MRIGILTDFPTTTTRSGPALHTAILRKGLEARGHAVVMLGPDTRSECPAEPGQEMFLFRAISHPTHPRIKVSLPASLPRMRNPPDLDILLAQTTNPMVSYANWVRLMWRVPVLNTHTIHLPTHSHYLLPGVLARMSASRRVARRLVRIGERRFAELYNAGDMLIVQSPHLVDYWRARGVVVPIEVLGRPIDESILGRPACHDPFPAGAKRGGRLLVVARHEREKSLDRLIRIFDEHVATKARGATLTLLGDGAMHERLKGQAARSRSSPRIFLPGEVPFGELVDWYRNADLFVYTSLSETFGNVVNEALYCGLPVVAFDDRMGVAYQVHDGQNGRLIDPVTASAEADWGRSCLEILGDPTLRATLGASAAALAAEGARLDTVLERLELLMETALQHCREAVKTPLSELSQAQQERSLRSSLRWWRFWNSLFIAVSYAANPDRLPHVLAAMTDLRRRGSSRRGSSHRGSSHRRLRRY